MKENHIRLRPDRLNLPLATCCVGRLSSAVWTVCGDVPDDVDALAVFVDCEQGGETRRYAANGAKREDGTWLVYLAPAYFPAVSERMKYHVVATDALANPRWLGSGDLRVLDCPADGSAVPPVIPPQDWKIFDPATGKYHRITLDRNEYGEVTLSVEQEGE